MACEVEQENIRLKKRIKTLETALSEATEQVREMLVELKAKE